MGKQLWMSRADVFQDSLDALFAAPKPQYLHNRYPSTPQDDELFNYWWLAHGIDCRLDAYHRSGDTHRLEQAVEIHNNIIERNHGSLFNDYFDDMLWFALSTLRLHEATHDDQYRDEATQLWNHVIKFGWNDIIGPSLSWRKQQPYYKNTPANAPLSILGARLYMLTGEERYIEYAQTAFDWITHTLVRPNGFVCDGINRHNDMAVDNQWNFTYNQGTYIGAALELAACLQQQGHPSDDQRIRMFMQSAERTAHITLDELVHNGVFVVEGNNGDEGLFKGIFYRYIGILVDRLPKDSSTARRLIEFTRESTDRLWSHVLVNDDGAVLAGNDWNAQPQGKQYYSTELSAIMAVELRAHIETASSSA